MKYYVKVLDSEMVVSADSELEACLKCSKMYGITTAGLKWKVSQLGFDFHEDDSFVGDALLFSFLEGEENESF